MITADHGNAEQMWDDELKAPHTAHTSNPVPVILCDDARVGRRCATARSAMSRRRCSRCSGSRSHAR